MKRSELKNIINKSKALSKKQEVGNPFEKFKKSLPIEVDDNYRLESAWKAYGSPKDYKEALWQGLIQPIDENTIKLPSIGYNKETDEYEYLNKGKENEIVDKDIRVWDNDVIPLVKELKQGGFIRIYDEEKDCWKYSKNKSQETLNNLREINSFLTGGLFGDYELFVSGLPDNLRNPNPNYNMRRYWELNGKPKTWFEALNRKMFTKESDGYYHAGTVAYNKDTDEYEFMKLPNHPTILKEIDWYNSPEGFEFAKKYKLIKPEDGSAWKYVKKEVEAFKQGGQMNVIPEAFKLGGAVIPSGSLHAHKNHMQLASEGIVTPKGIPVISEENGEILQLAEIEREEVIFDKLATTDIENLYKKFNETNKLSEKDELAIKAGKILTDIFINNTEDNTGLIEKVADKNNLEYNK